MGDLIKFRSRDTGDELDNKKLYRFDVFKGMPDHNGKIEKTRSVGYGSIVEGYRTCRIRLKCFLNEEYFLIADRKNLNGPEFALLTREYSQIPGKKYFWNTVGTGALLCDQNVGLVRLSWDVFGSDDIYIDLTPLSDDQTSALWFHKNAVGVEAAA